MSIGFTEILLIVLFVLLVFGAKRIPELARALGRAAYEFRKAKESLTSESEECARAAAKAGEQKVPCEPEAQASSRGENKAG
ncbi:MAG: twin-arginine translocase TatA/TatE family subunit [Oligosphaeraceae bacterium]|mgnify:CR=1 FL=1|nr:twin-arginine translocase TatA/TatE family subunit [Oligosphaeraceae bacterium]